MKTESDIYIKNQEITGRQER